MNLLLMLGMFGLSGWATTAIWMVGLLVLLMFAKSLTGVVYISQDKVGIVNKKFSTGKRLDNGAIVALNGEAGIQAATLPPGLHFGFWPWKYGIQKVNLIVVPPGTFCQVLSRVGEPLAQGRNLANGVACNKFQDVKAFIDNHGQKGQQLAILTAGSYRINTEVFEVQQPTNLIEVRLDFVGIVIVKEGQAIDDGEMAKSDPGGHDHFQDAQAFLAGGGFKGLQISVLQAGRYAINPWFATVDTAPMTEVPVGHCAVVISYVNGSKGELPVATQPAGAPAATNAEIMAAVNAKIVDTGQKGVWRDPLGPGRYPINIHVQEVVIVPVTQISLYWADSKSQGGHHLDDELSTIILRTKDAFNAKMEVVVIVHIPMRNAPQIVANFGNVQGLVSQVLQSTISSYFRNSAQSRNALELYQNRTEIQSKAKEYITEVLTSHFVECKDVLIDDVILPDELIKPITDREIANQQKDTYITQRAAETERKDLVTASALADAQGDVVRSQQGVVVAEQTATSVKKKADGEAYRITTEGKANGESVRSIGDAEAAVIKAKQEAMPAYAQTVIAEYISQYKGALVPTIQIGGDGHNGGGSLVDALIGTELFKTLQQKNSDKATGNTP